MGGADCVHAMRALYVKNSLATLPAVASKPGPLKLKVMVPRNRSGVQDY